MEKIIMPSRHFEGARGSIDPCAVTWPKTSLDRTRHLTETSFDRNVTWPKRHMTEKSLDRKRHLIEKSSDWKFLMVVLKITCSKKHVKEWKMSISTFFILNNQKWQNYKIKLWLWFFLVTFLLFFCNFLPCNFFDFFL